MKPSLHVEIKRQPVTTVQVSPGLHVVASSGTATVRFFQQADEGRVVPAEQHSQIRTAPQLSLRVR